MEGAYEFYAEEQNFIMGNATVQVIFTDKSPPEEFWIQFQESAKEYLSYGKGTIENPTFIIEGKSHILFNLFIECELEERRGRYYIIECRNTKGMYYQSPVRINDPKFITVSGEFSRFMQFAELIEYTQFSIHEMDE